jgi:hypothetical protein
MLIACSIHDVLVWGPASDGERTSSGRVLPAGWVWCCSCGLSGAGFATEDEACDDSDTHVSQSSFTVVNVGDR